MNAADMTPEEAAATFVSERSPGLMTDPGRSTVAQDYLHVTNPETGLEVVFVPGEALPKWAQALQIDAQRAVLEQLGMDTPPAKEPAGKRAIRTTAGKPKDRA